MTSALDPFDELDRIEALADPTAADLARLDAIVEGQDSLLASLARMARDKVRARLRAVEAPSLRSEGSTGQRGASTASRGSDPSLAEPYTAAASAEDAPSAAALHPAGEESAEASTAEGHATTASPEAAEAEMLRCTTPEVLPLAGPCCILFSGIRNSTGQQTMATRRETVEAFAYVRTSSAANVGEDKDSDKRQLAAVQAYAKRAGVAVVEVFTDAAVRGGDPIDTRPGFAAMLERIESGTVRTIVVETANRFARDLMVQEVGFAMLQERGINLVASDSPTSFLDDTPTARLIRQVLGAVSEFEKAMVVAKLRGARDRKRNPRDATGRPLARVKVEGRKSIAETRPEVITAARSLARARPKGGTRSLREISAELAAAGHLTGRGTPYTAAAVAKMIERRA